MQSDRDILMRIGSALRTRRLQHGLTQRALSQLSKIDRNYKHPIANVGVTLMGAVYVALPVSAMLAVPQLLSGQGEWLP